MLVIGLTGGIGSGKSTVAKLFMERGVPVIDADVIAREVTKSGSPALTKIIEHFGQGLLLPNNNLDRTQLRQLIFDHPKERQWLENLLHPLIRDQIEQTIQNLSTPYCIAVIPLLLEVKPYPFINRILVVDAPEHLQITRVIERDNAEKSQVTTILNTQINRYNRLHQAHDVIHNEGTLADLIPQIEKLHQTYLSLSQD